ncbi:MAG: helix-turn-helix transcriptional regulator [Aggregatilineales bacterium]
MVDTPLAFSEILNLLFAHRTRTDGTPYRAADVARATGISASQLSLLISGQRQNTSLETARSIISFFDVSMEILNASTTEQAVTLINQTSDDDLPVIHLRSHLSKDLSPRSLRQIQEIIEWVLDKENAERTGQPTPPQPDFNDER